MSERIAWLNGEFLKEEDARVSIFDRGMLFGDGVYDVATVLQGRLLDGDYHLARLERSCGLIGLTNPHSSAEWIIMMKALLRKTGVTEGMVYLQVTRGVAERDFPFPGNARPTAFAFARTKTILNDPHVGGVRVVTTADLRWARRDIKAIALLAPVLAKQYAREQNAFEVFLVEDNTITEGGSSNAYMVKNGVIVTRALSRAILPGVTRHMVLDIAEAVGIACEQRPFTVEEARAADELFLSSATTFVLPVTQLDDKTIANGKPGPLSIKLRELYIRRALELTNHD
ncbi:MAG: D-amino-acid transaminase [Gemmatimonadaceae bacterium]